MPVRPLPGASYHTLEAILHSFANVDPEAVGSLNAYDPSEKQGYLSEECTPLLSQPPSTPPRHRREQPILLFLILFFCLAFVASAFWGYSPHHFSLSYVPDRHAPLADYLASALQAQPYRTLVNENYDTALKIFDEKLQCSRGGCHEANLRDHLVRTFPLVDLSLNRTDITESALVLHWPGTDSGLKPVLITNSDALLHVRAPRGHARVSASGSSSPCSGEETEGMEVFADVQSAVGMLTAIDALLRSGHQPSRTLVLTLMLGNAADAPKVSEYLYTTYGDFGLGTESELPVLTCKGGRSGAPFTFIVSLPPTSAAEPHVQARPLDDAEPRMFRYTLHPTVKQTTLTKLRVLAIREWAHLILGADGP